MPISTVTPFPNPAPDRNSPALFNFRSTSFVSHLGDVLLPELNTVIGQLNQMTILADGGSLVTAYGLGGVSPEIGDCAVTDQSIVPGVYHYDTGGTSSGGPDGAVTGHLWHTRRQAGGGESQQFIWENGSGGPTAGTMFTRARSSSAWGEWLPGGIESGSNANGDYTRHPDGSQTCTGDVVLTYLNTSTCQVDWTFPAAFSAGPVVTASINAGGSVMASTILADLGPIMWANSGANTTIGRMNVRRITGTTNFTSGDIVAGKIQAIGRWY